MRQVLKKELPVCHLNQPHGPSGIVNAAYLGPWVEYSNPHCTDTETEEQGSSGIWLRDRQLRAESNSLCASGTLQKWR